VTTAFLASIYFRRLIARNFGRNTESVLLCNDGSTESFGSISCSAGRQMRLAVGLFVTLLLGGCLPDQAKSTDVTACRDEADRFYQAYNNADMNNPRSKYIVACMAAKGYIFEVSPADCDSRHALVTQSTCYVSKSWIAWIFGRFRSQ
jgi:hypothetical protein